MKTVGSDELVFEKDGAANLLDCSSMGISVPPPSEKVLGMTIGSEPMYKPYNGVNSFFNGCWDPLFSQAQNAEFRASPSASYDQIDCSSYTGILENQGTSSTSHLIQHQSDHSPNLPHFVSRSFSEMDSFFALHNWHQIVSSSQPFDYPLEGSGNKKELTWQSAANKCSKFQNEYQISDEGTMEPSPKGKKRKRVSENQSQIAGLKNWNTEQEKDECTKEQNEEKQKPVANLRGKLAAKEVKDNSNGGEAPKENYVHVSRKRGQATNSHSLAERVRRERISERMKFLQELVPGCSKITGKAVMLDEIINYVLSLQRQVEFLSMKLAHVCPEMNVEIERILSRNIHHSQGGSAAILGDPEMSSSYHIPKEILQGALPAIPSSNLQPPSMSQLASIWHDKLQSSSQMDFISNPASGVPELNGCMKVEL